MLEEASILNKNPIKEAVVTALELPGVYKFFDQNKKILYIGKAKSLKKRLSDYLSKNHTYRIQNMIYLISYVETMQVSTEAEALLLEANLIKKLQPRFNILLKDDKSYPYIRIYMDHKFPSINKYRGKNVKQEKNLFGPFASIKDVDKTLSEITKIFKIRTCSDSYFSSRQRPCLQFQIQRCSAPCVDKISAADYMHAVSQVNKFLSGNSSHVKEELTKLMEYYSNQLEYEKAMGIRDKIRSLSYIELASNNKTIQDADIIGAVVDNNGSCVQVMMYRAGNYYGSKTYFPLHAENTEYKELVASFIGQFYQDRMIPKEIIVRHVVEDKNAIEKALAQLSGQAKVRIIIPSKGFKVKLLEAADRAAEQAYASRLTKLIANREILLELKNLIDLDKIPEIIEAYDNSHISGTEAVGAVVVVTPEGFDRSKYRAYKIKDTNIGDDYAMLAEGLSKRFEKIKEEKVTPPDLMIIDGGKGHLSQAMKVMEKHGLNIPILCMSKGKDRNAGMEQFHMYDRPSFTLNKNDRLMKYLQIIRDEVHNFAIKSHRKRRSKALKSSILDELKFIGPKRKKALLSYFGSIELIKDAKPTDLEKVKGISKSTALLIYNSLHSSNY